MRLYPSLGLRGTGLIVWCGCRRRERLLAVTARDVQRVAQTYLVEQIEKQDVAVAVLGEKKDWIKSEDGWDTFPLSLEPETKDKVKL